MNKVKQIDEVLLTPEYIERLKARDPRFNDLDLRLSIERELRDSAVIKTLLQAASDAAALALEDLAEVDPTDTKLVIRLQAAVFRARFIARTLNSAIKRGEVAEQNLNDEQQINIEEAAE